MRASLSSTITRQKSRTHHVQSNCLIEATIDFDEKKTTITHVKRNI